MPRLTEHSFSVDDFKNPKVYKDAEAMAILLTRLLLLEPGTFQSHPEMGVGLMSRYRYSVEGAASKLKADFEAQIEAYLPDYFQGTTINVTQKGGQFLITAEIDGSIYGSSYDSVTNTVESKFAKLSDM